MRRLSFPLFPNPPAPWAQSAPGVDKMNKLTAFFLVGLMLLTLAPTTTAATAGGLTWLEYSFTSEGGNIPATSLSPHPGLNGAMGLAYSVDDNIRFSLMTPDGTVVRDTVVADTANVLVSPRLTYFEVSGRWLMAYLDATATDVFSVYSTNDGATWSSPTTVTTNNNAVLNHEFYVASTGVASLQMANFLHVWTADEGDTWSEVTEAACDADAIGDNKLWLVTSTDGQQQRAYHRRNANPDSGALAKYTSSDACVTTGDSNDYTTAGVTLTTSMASGAADGVGVLFSKHDGTEAATALYVWDGLFPGGAVELTSDLKTRGVYQGFRHVDGDYGTGYVRDAGIGGGAGAYIQNSTGHTFNADVSHMVTTGAAFPAVSGNRYWIYYEDGSGGDVWISSPVPDLGVGGPPAEGNVIEQAKQFAVEKWGFSEEVGNWLFALAVIATVIVGFAKFGTNPLILSLALLLGIGLAIALGFLEVWVLFVFIFVIIAVAGHQLFGRGDSSGGE